MSDPLLRPLTAGALSLPNRVLMAPMTRNRADARRVPTPMMVEYYRQRAGAGLIVTEATTVSPEGYGYVLTPGILTEAQVEGWKPVTEAVHRAGGRIALQLWHVGRASHRLFQPGGALPVAPSAVGFDGTSYTPEGPKPIETPRALEAGEIRRIVEDYGRGAANARRAGFDAVELHGANGYLIDQFLRDGTNRRTDAYGGSPENRARFLLEVFDAASAAWAADRVGVRLSPSGTFNGMFDSDPEATFGTAVDALSKRRPAYLHVVEPDASDARHAPPGWKPVPSSFFRKRFEGPLIGAGGYTGEAARAAVASGAVDAVAFARAFLANPDLVERLRRGAALNTPDPGSFYGGTERGYTDYPALAVAAATG
jgi:N-ethylmaleimide reductase